MFCKINKKRKMKFFLRSHFRENWVRIYDFELVRYAYSMNFQFWFSRKFVVK